jgi:hypothetical protein
MLAAAGGPDVDPHAASDGTERARWERDLAGAAADLRRIDAFLMDVIDGRLTDQGEITRRAMSFFGDAQGGWYTVGYLTATTIERVRGRAALVALLCDPPALLAAYNAAAAERTARGEAPPVWSGALLAALGAAAPAPRER